jgi:PEP-CTERM motif
MMSKVLGTLVVLVLVSSISEATPFLYDESVSGDLPCQSPPCATTFAFDVGTNIIIGTVTNALFNFDSFSFSIPAGTELTSVVYSWTLSGTPTVTVADTGYALTPNTASFVGFESINLVTQISPVSLFNAELPVGAGTYALFQSGLGGTGGETWTSTYEIDLTVDTVQEVPEPSSLSLLATVVGVLGWRKRATAKHASIVRPCQFTRP